MISAVLSAVYVVGFLAGFGCSWWLHRRRMRELHHAHDVAHRDWLAVNQVLTDGQAILCSKLYGELIRARAELTGRRIESA